MAIPAGEVPAVLLDDLETTMLVPPGYGTMVLYLFVEDPDVLLEFLKSAFDATELGRTKHPRGGLANLRLRIGSTKFMVAPLGGGLSKMPAAFKLFVPDVDQAIVRAISSGAVMQFAPVDMPYGDRLAAITDPAGNTWFLSTRLTSKPYDSEDDAGLPTN